LESVVTLVADSVQLAPDDGAAKVTDTPLAGVPFVVTCATSAVANAVPTIALCGVPLVAVIATVGGGVVELELLLQPVRNARGRQTKTARMLQ
jgi:hypothetical protein